MKKHLLTTLSVLALGAAASMVSGAAHANLIVDGDFAAPGISGSATQVFYRPGDSMGGWTVVGATGNVGILAANITGATQSLDLTGNTNSKTGVQQSVVTTQGASYILTFEVGNYTIEGTTSTDDVFINATSYSGTPNFVAVNGIPTRTFSWEQFTYTFTATSALTTIAFINGDTPGDGYNGLNNVVLTQTNVPEPASMALLGVGLLGTGVIARRRRTALTATAG